VKNSEIWPEKRPLDTRIKPDYIPSENEELN
jgi:hypothetical protein